MKILLRFIFSSALGLFLIGCGSNGPQRNPASLGGNWLLVGSMPSYYASTQQPEITVTIDVDGSNIKANGFGNYPCGSFSSSFQFELNGAIDKNGSFNLAQKGVYQNQEVTISGQAPIAGGAWLGNYILNFGGSCAASLSGNFNATPISQIKGVYAGTLTGAPRHNDPQSLPPLKVQLTLQQGSSATDPTTGKTVTSNLPITANIQVENSSCFTSGTASGQIRGNFISAKLSMDTGGWIIFNATFSDTGGMHLDGINAQLLEGKCGYFYPLPALPTYWGQLDRQTP